MKRIYNYFFNKNKKNNANDENEETVIDYKSILKKLKEDLENMDMDKKCEDVQQNYEYIELTRENTQIFDFKFDDKENAVSGSNIDINNLREVYQKKFDVDEQKKTIIEERINRQKKWVNNMENTMMISPNDSIIFTKLLVSEAFRRDERVKVKYYETCNNIFRNHTDPKIIKSMIIGLPLFIDPKDDEFQIQSNHKRDLKFTENNNNLDNFLFDQTTKIDDNDIFENDDIFENSEDKCKNDKKNYSSLTPSYILET